MTSLPCYVHFSTQACTGCGKCLKVCPTQAIRIKDGKTLHLVDNCIGCGECIRVCPHSCILPETSSPNEIKNADFPVIFVAPVLYSQFAETSPGEVLLGLKSLGFKHTVDMSFYFEQFLDVSRRHLQRLKKAQYPHPVISTLCPVVLRLIAFKFPDLLPYLHPIHRPVSLMVKEAVSRIADKHAIDPKEISIFYLNPCPTKMEQEASSRFRLSPYTSRAIGVNQIYTRLKHAILKNKNVGKTFIPDFDFEEPPHEERLLWGISGGETRSLENTKSLSISGLEDTMEYLEKMEMGLFSDREFIEFRTCHLGCVGGSLCVTDKYVAQNTIRTLIKTGKPAASSALSGNNIFDSVITEDETVSQGLETIFSPKKKALTIEELTHIDKLLKTLPGYNCTACGAPNCATFAEDLIRGRAKPKDCLLMNKVIKKMKKNEQFNWEQI